MKKNNKVIIGVIVILIVIGLSAILYFSTRKNNDSNYTTKQKEYTILLKDVAKIGDYVQYIPNDERFTMTNDETGNSDRTFQVGDYKGNWKVMYNDNENGLQIISSKGVTSSLSLANKFGYNNAIDTLNSFCNHYANNADFAISGRCLGSNPKNPKDNSETEEHFSAGTMKLADENYTTDIETLNHNSSLHSPSENTILASRYKGEQGGLFKYCLRKIDNNGNLKNDSEVLCFTAKTRETEQGVAQYYSMNTNAGFSTTGYIRPVITLKQELKIKSGDGTKENPYVLAK